MGAYAILRFISNTVNSVCNFPNASWDSDIDIAIAWQSCRYRAQGITAFQPGAALDLKPFTRIGAPTF